MPPPPLHTEKGVVRVWVDKSGNTQAIDAWKFSSINEAAVTCSPRRKALCLRPGLRWAFFLSHPLGRCFPGGVV